MESFRCVAILKFIYGISWTRFVTVANNHQFCFDSQADISHSPFQLAWHHKLFYIFDMACCSVTGFNKFFEFSKIFRNIVPSVLFRKHSCLWSQKMLTTVRLKDMNVGALVMRRCIKTVTHTAWVIQTGNKASVQNNV